MTEREATDMATQLLATYGDPGFEISMPDEASYHLMQATLASLNRPSSPDGEFFVIKVFPSTSTSPSESNPERKGEKNMKTIRPNQDNSDGMAYVKSIRDSVKRRFASEYLTWLRSGRAGKEPGRGALSLTISRAVTANLDALG